MIQRLHNWKDKIQIYFLKNYKSASFLVLFVLIGVFMRPQEGQAVVGWLAVGGAAALGAYAFGDEVGPALVAALVSVVGLIIGAVNTFLFWLITIVIWMIVQVASFQTFINEPSVIAGWTLARDVVNMGFILYLLYLAFTLILGLNKSWQGSLMKLLLMVVLVNFSRMIVGVLIDVSQVIMLTFVNGFRNIVGGNIIGNLNLKFTFSDMSINLATAVTNITRVLLGTFIGVILLSTLAMMAAWLLLRIVKLWLLTILSPFYFLTMAAPIPGVGGFTSYWKKEFTNQLISGPFMAFGIWFSMSLLSNVNKAGSIFDSGGQYGEAYIFGTAGEDVSAQSQNLYRAIIGAGLLYGVFDMSKKMAGEAAVVGTKVFSTTSKTLKSSAMGAAKALDWGSSQASQRLLGRDFSVAGAKRYWGGKVEEAKEWKRSVEAGSIIKAEKIQKDRLKRRTETDLRYKELGDEKMTLGENAKQLEDKMAKDDKSLSLKDRLEADQKAASVVQEIQSHINNNDYAKARDFLNDPKNADALSPDLRNKLKNSLGWGALSDTERAGIGDMFGGAEKDKIMDINKLRSWRNSGFINNDELEAMKGKSFTDLESVNPDLAAKLTQRIADADSFKTNRGQSRDLQQLLIDGAAATYTLDQWGKGQGGQIPDAYKQTLGLSNDDTALLSRDSLAAIEARTTEDMRKADEDALKDLEEKIKTVGQAQYRVESKYKADYLKSNSTRVRGGRLKQARADQRKMQERRFPLHETVDDLVELATNPSLNDPEIMDFVVDKLKPEDAPEFFKRAGNSPDITGFYEFLLKRYQKYDDTVADILKTYRTTGDLTEDDEATLMGRLNDIISNASAKESVQQLVSKAKKEIPSLRYAVQNDRYTGKFQFTGISEREETELEDLLRRHISPEKYEGFVYEQDDGSFDLSSVGYSYFVKAFGKVVKKMQDYNDDYLQALVKNQNEILSQVGSRDKNYGNIKKSLDELEKYVYNLKKKGAIKTGSYQKFKKPRISNNP